MATKLDTSGYDRVIALDTQMIFEARPLAQFDWSTLSTGSILLLVLPQVSAEVDSRKRDGRLGQRARDLNRLIEPSIETGGATPLTEQPVRVDITYVAAGPIDWARLDDLERDNGDDRIIAQALHALIDDPARVEVMSFDSRPRAAARRHGAGAIKPDESWLLEPEPSPTDRRVAELVDQRVKLLQASEPQFRLAIRTTTKPPLARYRIPPLPAEAVEPVVRMILAQHPREHTGGMMAYGLHINSDYDEEYDAYAAALSATDVPSLHLGVARQFSQYAVEVSIDNVGVLAAEHVTVEFRSGNAVLHATPYGLGHSGRSRWGCRTGRHQRWPARRRCLPAARAATRGNQASCGIIGQHRGRADREGHVELAAALDVQADLRANPLPSRCRLGRRGR